MLQMFSTIHLMPMVKLFSPLLCHAFAQLAELHRSTLFFSIYPSVGSFYLVKPKIIYFLFCSQIPAETDAFRIHRIFTKLLKDF